MFQGAILHVIISKMELPDVCPNCHEINMVDWRGLERRLLSKSLFVQLGYSCRACERWKPCCYTTRQLDEKLHQLDSMLPAHPSYYFYFVKAYKRAEEIQRRGKVADGSFQHKDMAFT